VVLPQSYALQKQEIGDLLSAGHEQAHLDFHLVPLLQLLHFTVLVAQLSAPVLDLALPNLPELTHPILQHPPAPADSRGATRAQLSRWLRSKQQALTDKWRCRPLPAYSSDLPFAVAASFRTP